VLSLGSALSPFRRDTRTINAAHPVNLKCWQTLPGRCLVSEPRGGGHFSEIASTQDLHLGRSFRVKHHVHCLSFPGTFVVKGFQRNSRTKFGPNRPARPRAVLVKTMCAPHPGG
jgi:hypothetical protein